LGPGDHGAGCGLVTGRCHRGGMLAKSGVYRPRITRATATFVSDRGSPWPGDVMAPSAVPVTVEPRPRAPLIAGGCVDPALRAAMSSTRIVSKPRPAKLLVGRRPNAFL